MIKKYSNLSTKGYVVLAFLLCTVGWGQSVSFFVEKALDQNSDLKAVGLAYEAALKKAPQVGQLPDPTLGVGVPLLAPETRLGAQVLTLSAQQFFPWFGTQKAKMQVALNQAQTKAEAIVIRRLEVAFEIKRAYYKLYQIAKQQSLIAKNRALYLALEQVALGQLESGKALATDALTIQMKQEALEQEIKILEKDKVVQQALLNALINEPINSPIQIDTATMALAKPPLNWENVAQKIKLHPFLKQLDWQIETASANLHLNTLEGRPSLGLGLDYSVIEPRTDAQPLQNGKDILMPKFKVSLPLYRKKIKAKKQEEVLKQEHYTLKKEEALNQLLTETQAVQTAYDSALLRFELAEKQLLLAQSAYKILMAAYSSEGSYFNELLNLQSTLYQYELNQLNALMDSHFSHLKMERLINF